MIIKQNPVDYYNQNHLKDALFIFEKSNKNIQRVDENSYTYMKTQADAYLKMFVVENNKLFVARENDYNIPKGCVMTAFDILMNMKFKGSFQHALNHVNTEFLKMEMPFIRVGTKYFKKTYETDRYNVKRENLTVWDKQTLNDDYNKQAISTIPKFDTFIIEPNNESYSDIIGNNYNLYSKFAHEPKEGEWPWIEKLIRHIFADQYEKGLQYLQVLYLHPKQALPILVLTSKERQTGKSTFIDFLNILFGGNVCVINPEDISNSFNSSYSDKNIICIEESRFESVAATEKLKNLSTQKEITVNEKFVPPYSLSFYGKLIITSNDENKFSRVDREEIRYWVRKIPTLKGKANHTIHSDIAKEIPAFLHHLKQLQPVDLTRSRMVFTEDEIRTKALQTVKEESGSWLYKEIKANFEDYLLDNRDFEFIEFTTKDIKRMFFANNNRVEMSYLKKVIKEELGLKANKTKRYPDPANLSANTRNSLVGRPFKIKNKYFNITVEGENNKFNM